MKRIIPLLLVAMCFIACEQKEKAAMSVANKTFYSEESVYLQYQFTTDSVYWKQFQSIKGGTYIQDDDVVIMKFDCLNFSRYAFVKRQFLVVGGDVYTLNIPGN